MSPLPPLIHSSPGIPRGMAFSNDGHFWKPDRTVPLMSPLPPMSFQTTAPIHSHVTSEDIAPTGMAFSNNGTKMFIVGAEGVDISEYTLSTPFELSAAEFAHVTFNVSKQDTKPEGMAFSNDGTKMFVVGDQHNRISEYTLSIPFNVTDAAHVHSFEYTNVSGQETAPLGMAFSNDGAKMFVIGDIGNDINEYTLTIPFNVTTAAHVHSFPVGKQESAPRGMAFSNDGAKMFVIGDIGNDINEYTLSTL